MKSSRAETSLKLWKNPIYRANYWRGMARAKAARRIAEGKAAPVVVPDWVPADLARIYVETAAATDEVEAAARVRALKRDEATS